MRFFRHCTAVPVSGCRQCSACQTPNDASLDPAHFVERVSSKLKWLCTTWMPHQAESLVACSGTTPTPKCHGRPYETCHQLAFWKILCMRKLLLTSMGLLDGRHGLDSRSVTASLLRLHCSHSCLRETSLRQWKFPFCSQIMWDMASSS